VNPDILAEFEKDKDGAIAKAAAIFPDLDEDNAK
jgi:hypothetical protein